MSAVIARYLPEFPPDPVSVQDPVPVPAAIPARLPAPASKSFDRSLANEAFDNPWAGLARAPRSPAPLPAASDVEARAGHAPAGLPESPAPEGPAPVNLAEVWRDGLQALIAPSSSAAPVAVRPALAEPVFAEPAFARSPAPDAGGVSPLVRPPAPRRETEEERAALIAAAEERGRQQGLAEARQEAEAARLRAAEDAEARLAEARRHWSAAEAEALADGFSAALRALDATLSDRIARLLVPVLTDALRRRAVAELSGALTRLLAEPQAATVRVSGPEDLLAALAGRLGPLATAVTFTAAETAEVQVSADQTVIDTQLGAWTRLIAAAVAET